MRYYGPSISDPTLLKIHTAHNLPDEKEPLGFRTPKRADRISVRTSPWWSTSHEPYSCSSFDFADTSKNLLRWCILVIQLVLGGGTGLFKVTGLLCVLMGFWIKREVALWESGHDVGVVGDCNREILWSMGLFIFGRLEDSKKESVEQIFVSVPHVTAWESGSDKFRKGKRPSGSSSLPLPYQIALLSPWLSSLLLFFFPTSAARSRLHLLPRYISQLPLQREIEEDIKRK